MRVTNNYQSRTLTHNSEKAQGNIAQLQAQIASGLSVLKPADNPAAAGKSILLGQSLGQMEQYERNTTYAESRLNTEENTLSSIADTLLSLRELALQANNDTLGQDDRQILLQEINSRQEQLLSLANTKGPNGEYLFSGTARTTRPYPDPDDIQYQGNDSSQIVNIGLSNRISVGTSGRDLFNFSVDGQSKMLFTTMSDFQDTVESTVSVAARAEYHAKMADVIAQLDAAHTHITTKRSDAGSQLSRIDSAKENNAGVKLLLSTELENAVGLDYAEAISKMESEIQSLEAIQTTYARLKDLSLFNYL